jgi:hypothetical protein
MKRMCIAAAILSCLVALLFSGAVFAEGELSPESPPPDETAVEPVPETEPIAEETPVDTVEPIIEPLAEPTIDALVEPVPEEEAAVTESEEEPTAVEETVEAASAEITALLAVLAEEDVVLVDASGEELAMASIETNEAIVNGDPWWKVGTTTYMTQFPGGCPAGTLNITCWESTTPINLALTKIRDLDLLPSDRILHIEAGTYTDTINLDGTSGNLGLLKGIVGVPSVEGAYTVHMTSTITIHHILSGFTLSGFDTDSNINLNDNNGTITVEDVYIYGSPFGITIYNQNGAIKLKNVRAEGNDSRGAYLDNTDSPNAGVEVTNSSFNFNTVLWKNYAGLDIRTNGPITIDGVSSSNNRGHGLYIEGASAVTIKNSVFSNNTDEDNLDQWGWGILTEIHRATPVTLDHVYANGNENYGIDISVGGRITLANVIASSNGEGGAYLDNCGYDSGTGLCNNPDFSPVTVKDSYFEQNAGDDGLHIRSKAQVTLTSIHAYQNIGDGVYVNNCNLYAGACQGTGGVTVSSILSQGLGGVNYFGWNSGGDGLYIYSKGAVNISNFEAVNNSSDGIQVWNRPPLAVGSVTIKSTLSGWVNRAAYNDDDGIEVDSYGTIQIDQVNASHNDGRGFELNNNFTDVVKNISLKNCTADWNNDEGVLARSNGDISITNSGASYNDFSNLASIAGLDIDNSGGSGNVTIKSTNIKDYFEFNFNSGNGVKIITNGKVTISNAIASYNADTIDDANNDGFNIGGVIDPKSVTMTRCSADSNGWNGVQIQSLGTVVLTNVSASNNANHGIITYSSSAFTLKTASGTPDNVLHGNGNPFNADGLYVNSGGTITVQNTVANDNNAYGFALHNAPSLTSPVKILRSSANLNHYGGIYLNTASDLTVTDTSADYNDSWGLYVDTDGKVLVNCTKPLGFCSFSHNTTGDGLDLYSRKTITISKIVASFNGDGVGDHGISLYSYFTPSAINLNNVCVESNYDYGIIAKTESNVTINSIIARYNGTGVYIGESANKVNNYTMKGTNLIDSNATGMRVYSLGLVNISNATIQYQTNGEGLIIYSTGEDKTVTLNNIKVRFNYGSGIYISSEGNVNLNYVRSLFNGVPGNDGDGLVLYLPDQEDIVTIQNSTFIYNFGNGIEANLYNPIDYTKFKLINTSYLGNDADNDGNADLFIY